MAERYSAGRAVAALPNWLGINRFATSVFRLDLSPVAWLASQRISESDQCHGIAYLPVHTPLVPRDHASVDLDYLPLKLAADRNGATQASKRENSSPKLLRA